MSSFPTNRACIEALEKLEAEARINSNKLAFTYGRALRSLRAHAAEVRTGEDALRVPGIGKFIATKLEEVLKRHHEDQHQAGGGHGNIVPPQPAGALRADARQMLHGGDDGGIGGEDALPSDESSAEDPPDGVEAWLERLDLLQYVESFVRHGFDNLRVVQELTPEDLEAIGIPLLGHRKTLLLASKDLKEQVQRHERRKRKRRSREKLSAERPLLQLPSPVSALPESTSTTPTQPSLRVAHKEYEPTEPEQLHSSPHKVPRLVIVRGSPPTVTDSFILNNVSDVSYTKGKKQYEKGKVLSLVLNGTELLAEVRKGAAYNRNHMHRATLTLTPVNVQGKTVIRVSKAVCDCEHKIEKKEGWCEHIVATLLCLQSYKSSTRSRSPKEARNSGRSNRNPPARLSPVGTDDLSSREKNPSGPSDYSPNVVSLQRNESDSDDPIELTLADTYQPWGDEEASILSSREYNGRGYRGKHGGDHTTKKRHYVPKPGSGAWAILTALRDAAADERPELTKVQLIHLASPLAEHSFEESESAGYTAWSSINTLLSKQLVTRRGRPYRYSLTAWGEVLAEQLLPYDGGHRTLGSLYEAPMETQETEDTLDTCLESLPPQNHEIQDEEASKAEYKDRKKRKCSDEKKDHCAGLSNKQLFPFLVKTETLEKPQDLLLEYTREKVVLIVSDSEDDNREHVKPETPPPDVPTSTWGGPSSDDRVRNGSTLGADDADGVLGEISKPYQEAEGTYEVDEVVMLLDNREIHETHFKTLAKRMAEKGVVCETRTLALGDMLWVARCSLDTEVPDESALEFVLDVVVERKRIADLASSYADGRYREQKFRLKRCGISQVLYLIEGKASTPDLSFFIEDATIATQVEDGFFIVRTENERDTASFLVHLANFDALGKDITLKRQQASVTKTLQEAHTRITTTIPTKSAKHNPSTGEGQFMTFKEFSKRASKSGNLQVSDVFAKQLMQIPHCTAQKALSIVRQYPTPCSLVAAYDDEENTQKQVKMLSALPLELDSSGSEREEAIDQDTGQAKQQAMKRKDKSGDRRKKAKASDTSGADTKSKKRPKARSVGLATSKKVYQFYNTFS